MIWYNSWAEVDMFASETWNVRKINDQLWRMNGDQSLPIPPSAQNLWFEGHTQRGSNLLTLGFDSQPEEAFAFARQFCDGDLQASYDPFNAIDTQTPMSGAIRIVQGEGRWLYEYYSYSENVPLTTVGVRCTQRYTHQPNRLSEGRYHEVSIGIRVEELSPTLSRVQVTFNRDGSTYTLDTLDMVPTVLGSGTLPPWYSDEN